MTEGKRMLLNENTGTTQHDIKELRAERTIFYFSLYTTTMAGDSALTSRSLL